jgi:hypothetical protein
MEGLAGSKRQHAQVDPRTLARLIGIGAAVYRCVRPSATPAKTNGLTNASGTATVVNSLDEAQNSVSTEYPRRTVGHPSRETRLLNSNRTASRPRAGGNSSKHAVVFDTRYAGFYPEKEACLLQIAYWIDMSPPS